ncbi:MAG: GTPase [Pseudomonadota bacterium]
MTPALSGVKADLTAVTLVTGARASVREAAIAAALVPGRATAVILEGLADAHSPLVQDDAAALKVLRIAPGCLCCTGNLVLRVTLNRLLRHAPAQLFISLADAGHVEQLRGMLRAAPYDALLALGPDLSAAT